MEVRNCRSCGRLYNYIGGQYRLCPDCLQALEDKFQEVKQYIDEHRQSPMKKISEDCGVSTKQIEQWIREERLVFSDDSPIGIHCEMCGTTIKSGRFCEKCKVGMANNLESAYGTPVELPSLDAKKAKRDAARMRFLDK